MNETAPAAAALPGKTDAEGWRRLHPLSPIVKGGLFTIAVVGILIANMRDALAATFFRNFGRSNPADQDFSEYAFFGMHRLPALGILLAVAVLMVLWAWIAWRFTKFRISDAHVELRKGVLARTQRRSPLARIQGVNITRPLLARFIGLASVEVQTADSDGALKLEYLSFKDAKEVRKAVLRSAAEATDEADPRPESQTSAGTLHDRIAELAQEAVEPDIDPVAQRSNSLVRVPLGRLLASTLLSTQALVFTLGFVVSVGIAVWISEIGAFFIAFPWLVGAVSTTFQTVNRGFNFSLSKAPGGLRISAGLTATATDSVSLKRIHAVEISQPILWRVFGWYRVRVTAPGVDLTRGQGLSALTRNPLPVGTKADALRVVQLLLPEMVDSDAVSRDLDSTFAGSDWVRADSRAWPLLWFANKRVGARLTRHGDHAALHVRGGFLLRRYSIIPVLRMQSVSIEAGLGHRALKLAKLDVQLVVGTAISWVRGLSVPNAKQLMSAIVNEMISVQRHDAETHYNRFLAPQSADAEQPAAAEQPADAEQPASPGADPQPERGGAL